MNAGEQLAHELFTRLGARHLQADWIILGSDNNTYLYEVKFQERFESPPFDGHGLPHWQVKARLDLQERTGMRAVLLIFDKVTGETFWQYIDELESGMSFDTNGSSPRRVYPLESFQRASSWRTAMSTAESLTGQPATDEATAPAETSHVESEAA